MWSVRDLFMDKGKLMKSLQKKEQYVNELKEHIARSRGIFFLTFRGVSVREFIELRKSLRNAGGEARVVKNTLLRRSALELGVEIPEEVFRETTLAVFCRSEPEEIARMVTSLQKEQENFKIKGGIYEGRFVDKKMVEMISKLPTKKELILRMIGLIRSPIGRAVYALQSPYASVIRVLYIIKKKKEEH